VTGRASPGPAAIRAVLMMRLAAPADKSRGRDEASVHCATRRGNRDLRRAAQPGARRRPSAHATTTNNAPLSNSPPRARRRSSAQQPAYVWARTSRAGRRPASRAPRVLLAALGEGRASVTAHGHASGANDGAVAVIAHVDVYRCGRLYGTGWPLRHRGPGKSGDGVGGASRAPRQVHGRRTPSSMPEYLPTVCSVTQRRGRSTRRSPSTTRRPKQRPCPQPDILAS
jgi:hypothetical protein